MLKSINAISIEKLMLDPANPRFADNFSFEVNDISDDEVASKQSEIIEHFEGRESDDGSEDQDSDQSEKYGVGDLKNSIKNIGFQPIDKPVVRRIGKSDKYIVIEGNRRICACKLLLKRHNELTEQGRKTGKNTDILSDYVLSTIKNIDVVELDLDEVGEEERKRRIRVILGIRHHGSLLEWDPLPRAYSIFKKYMTISPSLDEFTWENARAKKVSEIFTLKEKTPRKDLKSYIAFKQLKDAGFKNEADHYTLIQSLVTNTKLASANYIISDGDTFKLTEDSLSKINDLCQFSIRDSLAGKESKDNFKILREPKSVSVLARLVKECRNTDQSIAETAKDLLEEVETRERPLEHVPGAKISAIDELTAFMNRRKWVDEIEKLLVKAQEEENLDEKNFGATNDIIELEGLDKQLEVFRRVFQLNESK